MEVAFRELKKNAAAGVDGVTVREYEQKLTDNLVNLHERLKQGRYRAQPMRRVYIDKEDGKKRALSIPAVEDKIVQKAVVELLNRIYENDFLPCSYGYRPGRNAHDAVEAIQRQITLGKVSYVLDADIRDFFGSIDRKQLMEMLQKRVADKDLLRIIGKWLHVGVMEEGRELHSENGVYQGSVISPILANLYLHVVLDEWVEHTVKPRMQGEVTLYRFCDDFIVCFQYRNDAEKFYRVLPKRFERFGLALHPEKTRLIEFGRFAEDNARRQGKRPATFKFLGFVFYGAKARSGKFVVKLKTISKRMGRKLNEIREWCRNHRHEPVWKQRKHLRVVMLGHYNYYGRRSNSRSLVKFSRGVERAWKYWLGRRGQKGWYSWDKFKQTIRRYPLPKPTITQNWRGKQLSFNSEVI
jgi:group II intron reverse transcriptase/maturase